MAAYDIGATRPVGVLGTGRYLPVRVVGNDEVGAPAGVDGGWIEARTGIRTRHWAASDEATSDLAGHAGRMALRGAGLDPSELSFLVVATSSPDQPQPATACIVQDLLGARNAAAFDLNAVCSGFVVALATVSRLVERGGYGLVIGADVYSRMLDRADRRTAVLFGDGAGAVVLGPVPEGHGLLDTRLVSDGSRRDLIGVAAGGSRLPASAATLAAGEHWFRMAGRDVRDYVTRRVPPMLTELLDTTGLSPDQIDHFVPHQANGLMVADLAKELGLAAQLRLTVRDWGNTGAASVPITLDATARGVGIAAGENVLLAAFGGGMSMGAALLRW